MFVAVIHLYDLSRELMTGDGREAVRALREHAGHIRAADSRRADLQQYLVARDLRYGRVFISQVASAVQYAGFHGNRNLSCLIYFC
jgi:hypothetical protein